MNQRTTLNTDAAQENLLGGASALIDDQPSWGVVEIRPNMEAIAERSLSMIGYDLLVVRYTKLLRGARIAADGRRVRSRRDELQLRPFIPGYGFLPIVQGDDCTLVDGQLGIKRLFRSRDAEGYLAKPKLIRARVVEQIKQAAIERDETPRAARQDLRDMLTRGQTIRARVMPALIATITSLDDKGRAEWIGELLGREVRGTIEDTAELQLVEA